MTLRDLRHRHMRRRLVERFLRKITSRSKAANLSRWVP